jgi:hypothetical protein
MALEESLNTLLRTICARTSPDFAPPETERPYVTWQQIGGDSLIPLDSSIPSHENAEIQIDVWANTRVEAKSIIKQIEAALIQTQTMTARPAGASASDFDSAMRVYCSSQDFKIWHTR